MINKSDRALTSEFILREQDQEMPCQPAFEEDSDAALRTPQQK
jgi:hypothetical protein